MYFFRNVAIGTAVVLVFVVAGCLIISRDAEPHTQVTTDGSGSQQASGTGPSVVTATLGEGKWVVSLDITGNIDERGSSSFAVWAAQHLLFSGIAENWNADATVNVGGILLPPGEIAIRIEAAPQAQWAIGITPFQ